MTMENKNFLRPALTQILAEHLKKNDISISDPKNLAFSSFECDKSEKQILNSTLYTMLQKKKLANFDSLAENYLQLAVAKNQFELGVGKSSLEKAQIAGIEDLSFYQRIKEVLLEGAIKVGANSKLELEAYLDFLSANAKTLWNKTACTGRWLIFGEIESEITHELSFQDE